MCAFSYSIGGGDGRTGRAGSPRDRRSRHEEKQIGTLLKIHAAYAVGRRAFGAGGGAKKAYQCVFGALTVMAASPGRHAIIHANHRRPAAEIPAPSTASGLAENLPPSSPLTVLWTTACAPSHVLGRRSAAPAREALGGTPQTINVRPWRATARRCARTNPTSGRASRSSSEWVAPHPALSPP